MTERPQVVLRKRIIGRKILSVLNLRFSFELSIQKHLLFEKREPKRCEISQEMNVTFGIKDIKRSIVHRVPWAKWHPERKFSGLKLLLRS